jgi:hypothetical protein
MKAQMIAAILVLMTTAAWAGNEGPQATQDLPNKLIAQMSISSGFIPDWMPHTRNINIDVKGVVTATKTFQGGRTEVQKLARLAPEVLKNLKSKVESTLVGDLKEVDPEQPMCTDAPSTTYYAIHADGLKVAVAGKAGCKDFSKENATEADYMVKNALEGLSLLASLL